MIFIFHIENLFPGGNILHQDFLSMTSSQLHAFDIVIKPSFNSGGMKKVPTNNERNKKTRWSNYME